MAIRLRPGKDKDSWIIAVKVTPKGGKDALLPVNENDDGLKLKVSAPPEKGQANQAVIKLLSEVLRIPKARISIVSGETARQKQVQIVSPFASLQACLAEATDTPPDWFLQ